MAGLVGVAADPTGEAQAPVEEPCAPRYSVAQWVGMGALISVLLILYMGLWRGIWFDELLHFATGGMGFEYLIKTIDFTTIHVNHGQTGVYFLLDWALLKVFGASAVALRLPSLVSAFVMLVSALVFMRAKGFGFTWQAIAVLALGANETLMFYAGEARPYMPLAASAAAVLGYYALSGAERRRWWAIGLGVFGFLFGAVIHPYWIFVWGLIAVASLAGQWLIDPSVRDWARVWRYVAPGFVIPAGVLYLVVGKLTWMRRIINFGWDPDQIYNWSSLRNSFLQNHFSFVPYAYEPRIGTGEVDAGAVVPFVIAAVAMVVVGFLIAIPRCRTRRLLPPVFVFVAGAVISMIASYLSVRSQYIIFDRQWVAGMGLTGIAAAWFFAQWSRNVSRQPLWQHLPVLVYVGLILISATISLASQAAITVTRHETWQMVEADSRSIDALLAQADDETFAYEPRSGQEYLADRNIVQGGPVWDEFIRWYNHQAGMRPEYRDQFPSWALRIWPGASPEAHLCLPNHPEDCPAG